MKEQFRAILAGDLSRDEAGELLDRWCARASRSRLAPFVNVARTMRQRRDMILNAVEPGISNGRVDGLNTKVRLLIRRAYGFHSADAALALSCSPPSRSNSGCPRKAGHKGRCVTHMTARRAALLSTETTTVHLRAWRSAARR